MLLTNQLQQAGAPMRAAKSALLDATPGRLRDRMRVKNVVDYDCAGVDLLSEALAANYIAGPDTGRQTIDAVDGQSHGVVISFESHDGQHRSESFFAHHFHVLIDVRQNGRWKERSGLSGQPLTAGQRARSASGSFINMTFDHAQLALAGHRSNVRILIRAGALAEASGFRDYCLDELRGDALLNVTTLNRRARLARVRK